MTSHIEKAVSLSGQIAKLAEDGLRGIDLTIAAWPAEFQAIIWETVADIASRRAAQLRQGTHS
jgi:hypothetical protein